MRWKSAITLGVLVSACGAHVAAPVAAPPRPARIAFAMPAASMVPPPPPISLTASDGTGLMIASLEVKTRVTGPLAETELKIRFHNAEPRVLEGRFRLALPPRSFVSRLAMRIDGKLREADVVELPLARAVYEETLHARRDPLLVEQKNENEISARVFPIAPNADKEIIVGWIAEVDDRTPITIPLRGLPRIGELAINIEGEYGGSIFHSYELGAEPKADVHVAAPEGVDTVRSGDLLVARVKVPTESAPDPIGAGMIVLVDTSASRAPDLDETLRTVHATLGAIAEDEPHARVTLAAFDQNVVVAHDGPIGAVDEAAIAKLHARGALGASDVEHALAWAGEEAKRTGSRRVLLVSDGLATAGSGERTTLIAAARALGAAGVTRLDALTGTDVFDEGVLRALTTGTLAHDGVVVSDARDGTTIAKRLRTQTLSDIAIEIPHAKWVWPAKLRGTQEGDVRVVYAELPRAVWPAKVVVQGVVAKLASSSHEEALAERAVAKAKVDQLVDRAENEGWDDKKRAEVIALARKQRVPSPLTGLLVLETDADRDALAARRKAPPPKPAEPPKKVDDILAPPPPIPPPTVVRPVVRLAGAHIAKTPMMRQGATMVSGRLPAESIQSVVRQNMGRFRGCYTEGLARDPKLRGRVTTQFVIGRDGSVSTVRDAGSDLGDAKVISCILRALGDLTFAQPEGGIVTVTYPLKLRPIGEEDPEDLEAQATITNPSRMKHLYVPTPYTPPHPWTGVYDVTREALASGEVARALSVSSNAYAQHNDDVAAILALGESLEAAGLVDEAARAYGSIADVHPHRADMLRIAGGRLSAIGSHAVAIELLRRAKDDRPDQPSSHHLLAMALLASGDHAAAFEILEAAMRVPFAARYVSASRVLKDDLAFVAASWHDVDPSRVPKVDPSDELREAPTTLYVTTWESDASEVDVELSTATGDRIGETAQVAWSDGFGPSATVLLDPPATTQTSVRLGRRGPAGDAIGLVHVLTHDGRGHVTVRPRPFVLMVQGATAHL